MKTVKKHLKLGIVLASIISATPYTNVAASDGGVRMDSGSHKSMSHTFESRPEGRTTMGGDSDSFNRGSTQRRQEPAQFTSQGQPSVNADNSNLQPSNTRKNPYEKLAVDGVKKRSESSQSFTPPTDSNRVKTERPERQAFTPSGDQTAQGINQSRQERPISFDKNTFKQKTFQDADNNLRTMPSNPSHSFDKNAYKPDKKDEWGHKPFGDVGIKDERSRKNEDRSLSQNDFSRDLDRARDHDRHEHDRFSRDDLRRLPPPGRGFYRELPSGHKKVYVHNDWYFIHDGCFYRRAYNGYVWIAPPIGLIVTSLPLGYTTFYLGGVEYYSYAGVYYRPASQGYVVVEEPTELPPIWETDAPPADFIIVNTEILNVRSGPGSDFPVVAEVYYGNKLPVIGTYHEWYYIRLENGRKGWINSYYTYPEIEPEPKG